MLNKKTIAVVVPCYNEETQIASVIETMPDFVDRIIVIDDKSTDRTAQIVEDYIKKDNKSNIQIKKAERKIAKSKHNRAEQILQEVRKEELKYYPEQIIQNTNEENDRIILIRHKKNSGKGSGIISGYKWARDFEIDCIATMDGDGQMDPAELESICRPVIEDKVDYVKGNRLIHQVALLIIPKIRFFGNSVLSILTKIASGYWQISDTQTGYTAISKKALNSIRIHQIYRSYGYPNDVLVKLNIAFCTVREVAIKPVYDVGEKSKMNIIKVIPRISWLLIRSFFYRLWQKYLFTNFHPLFILYNLAFAIALGLIPVTYRIFHDLILGIPLTYQITTLFVLLIISFFQFLLFAMWMDIQDNERLQQ